MGAVASCAKKVWSGIKKVGSMIWNGVKTVAKTVVKAVKTAVGFIGGMAITIIVTAALVCSTIIVAVLNKVSLAIFSAGLLVLSLLFLSAFIIFGRENEEQKEEKNDKERPQYGAGSRPQFDPNEPPKKKEKDLSNVFFKDIDKTIGYIVNNQWFFFKERKKKFLYSFTKEKDIIKVEKEKDSDVEEFETEENNENNASENVLVSQVKFSKFDGSRLELMFYNYITNIQLGKEILEEIMDHLKNDYNSVKIIEDFGGEYKEFKDMQNIKNIEVIKMIIEQ